MVRHVHIRVKGMKEGIEVLTAAVRYILSTVVAGAGFGTLAGAAFAAQPVPWQMGLQPAASPIMEMIHRFNDGLLLLITLIVLFVMGLLLFCMIRFNARSHPVPTRTSHNTLIEIVWTIVPILILVGIAIPSFSLLFAEHDPARAIQGFDPAIDKQITIKATGSQWYWTYDYPDSGDLSFDSFMLSEEERAADPNAGPRLLAVDNEMVVPTGTVIRLQVIANDVIHAFAVPAFGVKIDAVPGRLNETWFRADREGVYYGQCSELCGRDHAFMPIAVRAVSPEIFTSWAEAAKDDLATSYDLLGALKAPTRGQVASAGH